MYIKLFLCICFFISNIVGSSDFLKRQVVASPTCGSESNNVTICTPNSDTTWVNDTTVDIQWKYNNPKLLSNDLVDLYLLYQPIEGQYQAVKNWSSVERTRGALVQHIDDSWYPSPIKDDSNNVTWTMYFYICSAGTDIQEDFALIPTSHNFFPAPQMFSLLQISRNTATKPTSSTSSTASSSPSSASSSNNSSSKKLPSWAIAVICIASLLFIAAIIALIWVIKRYKKKKNANNNNIAVAQNDEKLQTSKSESNVAMSTTAIPLVAAAAPFSNQQKHKGDISSIHSSNNQLWSPRSVSPRHDDISFTSEKLLIDPNLVQPNNNAAASSSILSSTDALMIADTFRQFMRKPEWNEDLESTNPNK